MMSESTSVIDKQTIQDRGHGSGKGVSSNDIHQEIYDFLYPKSTSSFSLYHYINDIIQREIRCIFTILMFLTRLPGPIYVDHHPGYLMMGMIYFPIIGTGIGIWISSFYVLCDTFIELPTFISSILSITSSLWLTGCFHEDGVRIILYVIIRYCLFVFIHFFLLLL